MARRRFGSIRELPSGRFQARRRQKQAQDKGLAATFDTRKQAELWLANVALTESLVAEYTARWGVRSV